MIDLTPGTIAEFIALILLGGALLLVGALVRPGNRRSVGDAALLLIAVVATGATAGSLYFSEVAHFIPCELCWFQRIAMYPMAVIAVIALVRRDRAVLPYLAVLAGTGLAVSAYHIGIQRFPDQSTFCDVTNPCSSRWVEAFGWVTIPTMAGLSFLISLALALVGVRTESESSP